MKTLKLVPLLTVLSGLLAPAAFAHGNDSSNRYHFPWDWSWHHDNDRDPQTVIVSPGILRGWVLSTNGAPEGSIDFVAGPGTAPLGAGSLEFGVTDTLQRVILANSSYAGTRLDDITALSFRTYRTAPATGTLAPSLQLDIDYDLTDTTTTAQGQLVFGPSATTPVTTGSWQQWNALTGQWHMTVAAIEANAAAGQPFPIGTSGTLTQILAQFPNAGIRGTFGNISLTAGGLGGAFTGSVDALTIGVEGDRTVTFDFEPDSDGDSIPDITDHCPDSDFRAMVDVGMGDTTVINSVDNEGCTIQDLVLKARTTAASHSKYVKAITKLGDALRKAGTITRNQAKELKNEATQSTFPN